MKHFQIQQSNLLRAKSFSYLNPFETNSQQNHLNQITVVKAVNTNSSPKLLNININNKRFPSPIPVKRINNEISPPKKINSYNNFNLGQLTKNKNFINNTSPNAKQDNYSQNFKTIKIQNYMNNIPINPNQNIINNYTNNIKNQNYMNNIIVSNNLINNSNNNLNNQKIMNNIIITQNSKNIPNNNIKNQNYINNINMVQSPNIISNTANNMQKQNYINGIISNQNIINIINNTPNNINYLKNGLNQFGKGTNNKYNYIPKVEIFLGGKNHTVRNQNIVSNNNIVQYNNLREPNEKLNLLEFKLIKLIGQGTFGKIYKVLWIINNNLYALKKEKLKDIEGVKQRQHRNEVIRKFIKNSHCKGIVNLYGNLTIQKGYELQYFELMELCDRDFEQEIKLRSINMQYYTEQEMHNIMFQLISTLSFLQKNHITHRDIKPQNILVLNGIYKLGDFGDIKIMQREGIVVQRIRGSELYMSPILFNGFRSKQFQVRHNTYKSDVFSLGFCFLLAACLSFDGLIQIRELSDMNQILYILNRYLSRRYSPKLIQILYLMLQTEEINRPDFITLEEAIRKYGL